MLPHFLREAPIRCSRFCKVCKQYCNPTSAARRNFDFAIPPLHAVAQRPTNRLSRRKNCGSASALTLGRRRAISTWPSTSVADAVLANDRPAPISAITEPSNVAQNGENYPPKTRRLAEKKRTFSAACGCYFLGIKKNSFCRRTMFGFELAKNRELFS